MTVTRKVKADSKSIFIVFNAEAYSEAPIKNMMLDSLKNTNKEANFKTILKKQIRIFFLNLEMFKEVEEALDKVMKGRTSIMRI